ncbi:TPA: hypothetical protein U0629_000788 [Streptococcus suis]|nr:hypothetical protein [Streptococcus suis]MCH1636831.1 hypothetical protein [Streptococcus suis]MCK3866787.1 hypothetical protein [Streptococcus suis]NQG11665.1 hypothetical protein [Streptococcus suis]NQG20744.1 hypothetical protein [Streptococcus suis]NQG44230.1 hypothetical protein [Streptococcus suis]
MTVCQKRYQIKPASRSCDEKTLPQDDLAAKNLIRKPAFLGKDRPTS